MWKNCYLNKIGECVKKYCGGSGDHWAPWGLQLYSTGSSPFTQVPTDYLIKRMWYVLNRIFRTYHSILLWPHVWSILLNISLTCESMLKNLLWIPLWIKSLLWIKANLLQSPSKVCMYCLLPTSQVVFSGMQTLRQSLMCSMFIMKFPWDYHL